MSTRAEIKDRARGALLGLAVGDALGAQVEFSPRGSFPPVKEMLGGGPHQLPAGYWTDDTAMALHLASSIIERGGLDQQDVARRWVRWMEKGEGSSNGVCFDIGCTTSRALLRFARSGEVSPAKDDASSGNGGIMRLAPVAIAYHADLSRALWASRQQSAITHGSWMCLDGATCLGYSLVTLMRRRASQPMPAAIPSMTGVTVNALTKSRDEVRGSGYVVDCLEAALWSFYHTGTFEDAVLAAVNLGDDADTTGAVVGQIAGAWYGASAIPERWLHVLRARRHITDLADALLEVNP